MSIKIKKVLSIIIKNNKYMNNNKCDTKPLLKAIQILTLKDLNKIQQFNFFDKNGNLKSYPIELDNIFEKLDKIDNNTESILYTFIGLNKVLENIDLQNLKDEDDI